MSWSFNESGPALEVATTVGKKMSVTHDSMTKNHANEDEVALMARAAHMIVVACHGMKDKYVEVGAHGSFNATYGHSVSVRIEPVDPPKVETEEPKGEPEPEKKELKTAKSAK